MENYENEDRQTHFHTKSRILNRYNSGGITATENRQKKQNKIFQLIHFCHRILDVTVLLPKKRKTTFSFSTLLIGNLYGTTLTFHYSIHFHSILGSTIQIPLPIRRRTVKTKLYPPMLQTLTETSSPAAKLPSRWQNYLFNNAHLPPSTEGEPPVVWFAVYIFYLFAPMAISVLDAAINKST